MRSKTLRKSYGCVRPTQRPLEGTRKVAMRGEPQRATLGVPDPDALNDWRLATLGLISLANGALLLRPSASFILVGVCCVWSRRSLLGVAYGDAAVTSGDSDSIAALAGAIIGAAHGLDAWLAE